MKIVHVFTQSKFNIREEMTCLNDKFAERSFPDVCSMRVRSSEAPEVLSCSFSNSTFAETFVATLQVARFRVSTTLLVIINSSSRFGLPHQVFGFPTPRTVVPLKREDLNHQLTYDVKNFVESATYVGLCLYRLKKTAASRWVTLGYALHPVDHVVTMLQATRAVVRLINVPQAHVVWLPLNVRSETRVFLAH
jgi:hypothetical protein